MYLFCVLLRVLFKIRCNFICPRVQLIHHHCVMWIAKLKIPMRTQSVVLIYMQHFYPTCCPFFSWQILRCDSLRKQPTFRDATTGLFTKRRPRNERKNSTLMTCNCPTNQKHYPDLGSDASSVWFFCARFSDVISRGNQW